MWPCAQGQAVSNLKWVPSTLAEVNFGIIDEAAQQMTEVMQHNTEVKRSLLGSIRLETQRDDLWPYRLKAII